jgi:hypothetical protein
VNSIQEELRRQVGAFLEGADAADVVRTENAEP